MARRLPHVRWFIIGVAVAVLAAAVGGFLYGRSFWKVHWYEPSRLETRKGPPFDAGRVIIQAIEASNSRHGKYPESLSDLVPEFLESIPKPGWGIDKWEYGLSHFNKGYGLSVRLRDDD